MNTTSNLIDPQTAHQSASQIIARLSGDIGSPLAPLLQSHTGLGYKNWLQQSQQRLDEIFIHIAKSAIKPWQNQQIDQLLKARALLVDCVLQALFGHFFADKKICLCAVGGYGRAELHPYSDIDIMLLVAPELIDSEQQNIEQFIATLWDLGVTIGHSVRTFAELKNLSAAEITICTALMESRLLAGDAPLYQRLKTWLRTHQDWGIEDFYHAKLQEQQKRYKKYDDEGYKVEPNIKYGPGGLRDLQNINWVAKRFYGAENSMFALDFLTELEHDELLAARNLLWSIRWALHLFAKRAEDRLLFEYQRQLATLFGDAPPDAANNDGVEVFMQRYYRSILRLERLNEMLLQLLRERIFATDHCPIIPINADFVALNNYLEIRNPQLFAQNPRAILQVFMLMQQHPELTGVGAKTIRAIRQQRHLVDEKFRRDKKNRKLFIKLLRQPRGVTREFRRMNRYGILARYLPAFGNIVGRMQFDLYHIYTVDQHAIAVLGLSRIFTTDAGKAQFPHGCEVYQQLDKAWLLHLAALFHDIGKGCGGDHSQIGAQIVDAFCRDHGLKKSERKLCKWLVRQHLLMSETSIRKDLSDPNEIAHFAKKVGDQRRLDMLYLLTISDINGTNPNLWTSWRAQLLAELYLQTRHALRRGIGVQVDLKEHKQEKLAKAGLILKKAKFVSKKLKTIWQNMPDEYFVRHSSEEIAWHARAISTAYTLPLVDIMTDSQRGASAILIYSQDRQNLFALMAMALDKLQLSVLDARVITTLDGKTMDTFWVTERSGALIGTEKQAQVCQAIHHMLQQSTQLLAQAKCHGAHKLPRQVRALGMQTTIQLSTSADNACTVLEVSTADSAGVLAEIGKAFIACELNILGARINTFGARVDDVFFITDKNAQPLGDQTAIQHLITTIREHLDHR